ncbi:MAG: response regulator transcription factor [Burkholderiaceae bacterium]
MIRVILVDDHAMIRRGLRETLVEDSEIRVVGEADDYAGFRSLIRETRCDVLVLDVNLPGRNGIEVLGALHELDEPPRVVVLSQYPEDQYGIRALKAGAMAYLNKRAAPAQILSAVKTVARGKKFVTPEIAAALMDSVTDGQSETPHDKLSEREMQTLLLIARGHKLAAIAEQLAIAAKTVSAYRARVMEKLQLHSNAEIAGYAIRQKLID